MPPPPDEFLTIDVTRLDEEWLDQPRLTRRVCAAEADARHEWTKAKARLDVVSAELSLNVRRNPDVYDLDKPTEKSIEATILLQPKYQAALEEVNDLKHALDLHTADVSATIDRRRALERSVDLAQMEYFGEPKARSAATRELDHEAKKEDARKPLRRREKADD